MDEGGSSIRKVSKGYAEAGPYISAGTQYAASIIVCLLVGWWLDGRLGTSPWLLLGGVVLGAVAGFYNLYTSLVSGGGKDTATGAKVETAIGDMTDGRGDSSGGQPDSAGEEKSGCQY